MSEPRITLIAEVSTNHGGNLDLAKRFIEAFAICTYVKFQWTRSHRPHPSDPQYAWFRQAEFSDAQFAELAQTCRDCGTQFLATVYHAEDVAAYQALGTTAIKIGSGEAEDRALAKAVLPAGHPWHPVFVSEGIRMACGDYRRNRVAKLRCVSWYPTPLWYARQVASQPYLLEAGWSDHVVGLEACHAALFAGATVIEKHVQLEGQARPPKAFEATVEEMQRLRGFMNEHPARFIGRWQHGG